MCDGIDIPFSKITIKGEDCNIEDCVAVIENKDEPLTIVEYYQMKYIGFDYLDC